MPPMNIPDWWIVSLKRGPQRWALAAALWCGVSMQALAQQVPLPHWPDGPVELRVAHVINPRLPAMDDAQLSTLLRAAARTARAHFGVELKFSAPVRVEIGTLFATIPPRRREEMAAQIFDFKNPRRDTTPLARAFGRGFRSGGEPLDGMVAYARDHTAVVEGGSYEAFGASMAALQLERVDQWRQRRALDGGPAIDHQPFNEFAMWLALGYGEVPYELLITNQIIASVEYTWPAVHTAVRGGYTNGITTYSQRSRFGTYSVWSTFAFQGNDEALVALRDGETYTPAEAAELAGISAVHELGHQLFHLLHPFGQTACVMNPVPMFTYRAWANRLSAAACPLGSSPAMTPGVLKFSY